MFRTVAIATVPQSHLQQVCHLVASFGRTILVGIGCLAFALPVVGEPSIAQQELQRRAESTLKAQDALRAGDKAYRLANYAEAVTQYGIAHDSFPGGTRTAAHKEAAAQRLAQAAVERARQLAKTGQIAEADALLETVLAQSVAPDYAPAQQMREQIHDPIHFNPALTVEHVRKIDEVRRLLYEAHGFNDLGQYDRAIIMFNEVLRIDPHNTAARRGIEAATNHKRRYFQSARDESRASMLTDVSAAWASPVPKPIVDLDGNLGAVRDGIFVGGATASEKLASIILPVIDMDQVGLVEAIDFLRAQSRALDSFEPVAARKGVAFVIELGTGDPARVQAIESIRFNLKLRNVPLKKVLDYINEATRTSARVDDHAVIIRPSGLVGDDIVLRQFRVPPDFLSRDVLPEGNGAPDPFADENATGRGLVKRLNAKEYLKQKGVSFPPGASASFSPSTSVLSVRTTVSSMGLVEAIVEAIVDAEPVMIIVEARIIRSTQNRIKELGFDWLMGASKVTDELYLGGGSVGNGTPISSFLRPVTSGNRSGNLATEQNSIDAAIARTPLGNSALRAPGSVTAFGLINNEIVATLMRGVNQNTGIDLMTKKTVITRSGQTASIQSIREFIYPTEYEPPELPNSVGGVAIVDGNTGQLLASSASTIATPATPTAFEMTPLGCTMEVLPQLGENGKVIEVAIKPEIRQFDGFIEYGTPITGGTTSTNFGFLGGVTTNNFGIITQNSIVMPVISSVRGETTLTIIDGETVVLGGLMRNSRVKVEDAVPILSKIPVLGRLFESESETVQRDAYIILVTVRLQDPSGQPVNR